MTDARLEFTTSIAREVGQMAQRLRADPSGLKVDIKGLQDFVTAADLAVETRIREAITKTCPEDAILGEEGGLTGEAQGCWIIDPIDGTTNFMRGGPDWMISIGYYDGTDLTHGVMFAPDYDAMLTGLKDGDAQCNGTPIKVSDRTDPSDCIVEIGYNRKTPIETHTAMLGRLLAEGYEYRRAGAATIGLMRLSRGWSEAYYEEMVNSYDVAAGLVIARAAGATVSYPDFPEFLTKPGAVFATSGDLAVHRLCTGRDS